MDVETIKLLVTTLGMGAIVGFIAIKVITNVMPKQLETFTHTQKEERDAFRQELKDIREHSDKQLARILDEHRQEAVEAWAKVAEAVTMTTAAMSSMSAAVAKCEANQK